VALRTAYAGKGFDSSEAVPYQRSVPVSRALCWLAAGFLAAACTETPSADDAGPHDAGPDGPVSARVCEADRPMPAEPMSAGSREGAWNVAWTCTDGCVLRRPGLTYSPQLAVEGATLKFSNAKCADCKADVTGVVTIDGCLDITGWADFDSQCRFAYRVCEMDGELNGTVTWKEPGVSEQVWQLHGTRAP
jgi:hypothetical protein